MASPSPAPKKKRVRLTPEVRKRQILDAALVEFGAHGFAGTSTEKIAQRVGLSQAGLYAHFKSKDDILEALLDDVFMPQWAHWVQPGKTVDDATIDSWIDRSYALIADPRFLSVMRIVVAEGPRLPRLINLWRHNVVKPYWDELQRTADDLVAQGKMQRNSLTEHFQLVSSPIVHALLMRLVCGDDDGPVRDDIAAIRDKHRDMLKTLVGVQATAASSPPVRRAPR